MVRDGLIKHLIGFNSHFRYRGTEPGRLENFSDAVFALAITMLLISTSAPTSFAQIKKFVWEVIPFALSITFVILIWHEHFTFFFRYGLRNNKVVLLNTIFLVIILFYVYPLKFLTRLILLPLTAIFNQHEFNAELSRMIAAEDIADLMIIYGLGVAALFFVLMLMYRTANKMADELELTDIEKFETRIKITTNLLMATVPILSVLVAIIFYSNMFAGMLSGFTYFLYTPVMMIYGRKVRKKRMQLIQDTRNSNALTEQSIDTELQSK